MERTQRDAKASGSIITSYELLSDSSNWLQVPYDYLFLTQCQARPDKHAVIGEEGTLTYRELERLSRHWAVWLISKGVRAGDKVLVCMDRTLELPAVLLGVLRAGACYVPADPTFPPDRIEIIIEDSDCVAVISDRASQKLLPQTNQFVHLVVEDKPLELEPALLPVWCPEDFAYLIFTSGSTGRPKGVPITRAAMVNFLLAMAERPGIEADDRVLALTTISFDISVLELFLPLIVGATIYLASKQVGLDPQSLSRVIGDNRVTLIQATPATWRLLYDFGWRPQKYQKLLCGGEAFPANLAEELLASAKEVWNMYGPTEATVWSSCHQVTGADLQRGGVPLGDPLPNISYRVCDSSGNPVSSNESGELWIGGVALTPGYYHRPELDEERFVFLSDTGKGRRFYRTGDLVLVRDDGKLVYLDRLDNQVKVRGHRIELGEIEAVLRQIEGVRDAVVIVSANEAGELGLIGCIKPGSAPDEEVLLNELSAILPGYMIPAVWFYLEEFPETPNRKIDRRKLKESLLLALPPSNFRLNTIPEELHGLAKLWERVLGSSPDCSNVSFLSMGGHSLSAARLSMLVEQDFNCWIEPVKFLANPSLDQHWSIIQARINEKSSDGESVRQNFGSVSHSKNIPVSSAQASMWYAGKLHGTHSIYNESEALFVVGRLDESVLSEAIQRLQLRHVAFSMVPEVSQGNLVGWNITDPKSIIPLQVLDWENECRDPCQALEDEARKSFDFVSAGPLIRFVLHRFASGSDAVQFIAHHTIIDGLSERQLWIDLAEIYGALESGEYCDDAACYEDVFERYLQQPAIHCADDIAYWRSIFDPMPAYLELKTDCPRPTQFNQHCTQEELDFSGPEYLKLDQCAKVMDTTPFQLLLAVFFIWLDRYSQQKDYVVGVPVSGRESGIAEDAIGLFMNTVPIREGLMYQETFSGFVSRLRDRTLEALNHSKLAFDALVESVNPDRNVGRTPLYQSIFSFNDQRDLPKAIGEYCLDRAVVVDTGFGPTEITMFADFDHERLRLRLKGSADLFHQETLVRMLRHFGELMVSAITRPETPVGLLNMLCEEDLRQISAANATARSYPRDGSIVSCFRTVLSRNPDAVAVEFGDQHWSYQELALNAERISAVLQENGVKKGDPVGVVASRHPDTVAALIGVLQLGATYVPLDTGYPAKRLEQMIVQSGARTVLVHSIEHGDTGSLSDMCDLVLIQSQPVIDQSCPVSDVEPMDRAYIMFTSGSTGEPKGIEVAHRNVLRLVKNTDFMPLNSETRFLMNSPVPFDASTLEIWGPLLNGGVLVIPEDDRLTHRAMDRVLREKRVNSVFLTTTLFHYFSEEAAGVFGSLRYLVTGGEVLSPYFAKKVLSLNPGLKLINGYGPTENTTFTCCFCMSEPDDVHTPIPIGKPIANSRVYILDSNRQLCPIGVPGEIYAGGDGVALGYINRPDLTQDVFIETDLDKSGRVYKTGDLARWLDNGNVEFLGRIDTQVKIRGFRIEPEEITLKVVGSKFADQAYTMPWRAPSGEQQLVCYFVRSDEAETADAPKAVRELLKESLPSYMVPTHIMQIDQLPTGPTGKIERSLLPLPMQQHGGATSRSKNEFQGECEKKLAEIWQEVLGRADFGRSDDFFMLGGSSLKALEVFSRIEESFGLNLPLAVLLKTPTISSLAEQIDTLRNTNPRGTDQTLLQGQWRSLVTLVDEGSRVSPIVCVHAVGGNVLSYRGLRHFRGGRRPVVGFQSRGLDGKSEPQRTIEMMASDYVDELISAGYSGIFTLMGGSMGGNIALAMAHQLRSLGLEVDWVILLDTIGPKARDYPDYFPARSIFRRVTDSVRARALYYGKAILVQIYSGIRHEVPYRLRPFWIEESNKKALFGHQDKPYFGDVLLIRAPESRGPVYTSPELGWAGVLQGRLQVEYVDVEHEAFMESEAVQEILQRFFKDMELNRTNQVDDNA